MSNEANVDTRVTPWHSFGHYGYTNYRIWTRQSEFGWQQRHEWMRSDGTTYTEEWIKGMSRHAAGSVAVAS